MPNTMDTIEKIQKLKKLSQKQQKISEFKKDIADILWNANMDEKIKIAKEMSKIEPVNEDQETNLGFIVPHIVKENYGNKSEIVIQKKEEPKVKEIVIEPIIIPTAEPVITPEIPKVEEKKETPIIPETIKPTTEKKEAIIPEANKPTEEKTDMIKKAASKINFIPGFDIQRPEIEIEATEDTKDTEDKAKKTSIIPEIIESATEEKKWQEAPKPTTPAPILDITKLQDKKTSKLKKFLEKFKWPKKSKKEKEVVVPQKNEEIKKSEEKIVQIEQEEELLRKQLEEIEKAEKEKGNE